MRSAAKLSNRSHESARRNVITALLPRFPAGELKPLIGKLRRIAYEPTEGERREEVDLAAAELLLGLTVRGDNPEKFK